jgi:hypothetical protein
MTLAPAPTTSTTSTPVPTVTPQVQPPPPPPQPSVQTPETPSPPPAQSTPPAPAPTSPSSGGPDGSCTISSPCSGDMTFYDTGLGSCGDTDDGTVEDIVALAHGIMGPLSNTNPLCGKTITVSYGGKTVKATVKDKCMGCVSFTYPSSRPLEYQTVLTFP